MPDYDFRCKQCQTEFTVFYKSYKDYEAAQTECVNCHSVNLARVIKRVAVAAPTRDFTRMNSNEMLSVFESGDSKQVGQMFQQIGGTSPDLATPYHEATKSLLKGESMDKVEKRLQEQDATKKGKSASGDG